MSVIGHEIALAFLRQAIRSHRLSPSLLLIGRDGIGKKEVAMELAKSLLCEPKPSQEIDGKLFSCDECESCLKVEKYSHPDVFLLNRETQALMLKEKTNSQTAVKIESIRHLDQFLQLKPLEGTRRVAVVEEADTMTVEAANALLKTLEEPPNNGQIILLADDDRNLPLTIKSRCAVLRLKPIATPILARWLNSEHGLGAEEALAIASRAAGSFGEALRLKDSDQEEVVDISDLPMDEFFDALSEPSFRKEGRERSSKLLTNMIEMSSKKLEGGDLSQAERLKSLLKAKRQLEKHVTPRLVLESVYLELKQ